MPAELANPDESRRFAGAILTALVLKPGVQQTSLRPEPALTH